MSYDNKPLITVFGATSKQGRSVTRTLLQSGRYRVRALTQNTDSPAAKQLAERGAELRQITLQTGNDAHLIGAFAESDGAFLMTPGFIPLSTQMPRGETAVGYRLADAAVNAGVKHLVFSSLENVERITAGTLWAPHFSDKGRIEEYIRTLPVSASFIQLAFFYTNLAEYYPPRKEGDELIFPLYLPEDVRAPFVDPLTATGPAVLEMFDNPEHYNGMTLPVVGECLSPREIVETFTEVSGIKARYRSAYTREALLHHFPDFADNAALVSEITGMTEYAVNYGYYGKDRDLTWSRTINPATLTWREFLIASGWQGEKRTFD